MITPRGQVKVLDFGLARMVHETSGADVETRTATQPGLIMGTVQYMSPEQALGHEVDHRSDIFSFGIMLYELIVGRPPFPGSTFTEILVQIAQPDPAPPLNVPNVPGELRRIVAKCPRRTGASGTRRPPTC